MENKRIVLSLAAMFAVAMSYAGQVTFVGDSGHKTIEVKPSSSSGLDKICVVYDVRSVSMRYEASDANARVSWYKFGALGGAYSEQITDLTRNGNVTSLNNVQPNCGYIIEEDTKRTYLWVVNYADYFLRLQSVEAIDGDDCGGCVLTVSGEGKDITYYTINGGLMKLDRQITIDYNTLEWSQEMSAWVKSEQKEKMSDFKSRVPLQAPLCDTQFVISGDAFLSQWGETQSVSSAEYIAKSVAVNAVASQDAENPDNMKDGVVGDALGGSAPAIIHFVGYPSDAVESSEWQMSYTQGFENVEERYAENDVVKTFEEAGTTYWRYVGVNGISNCEAESEIFTVSIGESSLQCPNAFSPGASEGVNDEWKVSYKSIVKFKCWIFNMWGVQVCELTDPSQGWNGKYKGKVVSPGVYYYVIEAEGSEGKKYKLKGDINIVGNRNTRQSQGDKTE